MDQSVDNSSPAGTEALATMPANGVVTHPGPARSPASATASGGPRRPWLTAADQQCVRWLTALALLALSVHAYGGAGRSAGWVELREPASQHAQREQVGFQLDVNQADWPEWTLLPRVGETLARRIVQSRVEEGPFATHDELQRVSGIGPKTLARLRPYLRPLDSAAQRAK